MHQCAESTTQEYKNTVKKHSCKQQNSSTTAQQHGYTQQHNSTTTQQHNNIVLQYNNKRHNSIATQYSSTTQPTSTLCAMYMHKVICTIVPKAQHSSTTTQCRNTAENNRTTTQQHGYTQQQNNTTTQQHRNIVMQLSNTTTLQYNNTVQQHNNTANQKGAHKVTCTSVPTARQSDARACMSIHLTNGSLAHALIIANTASRKVSMV